MAVHVQCSTCGAWAITDNHGDPDSAVRCTSEEDVPEGSAEGSCCLKGHTHEEHLAEVRETHDSNCRTLTITIMGTDHGVAPSVQLEAGQ